MEVFEGLNSLYSMQLLTAAGLGALIGLERELAGKDPSLRTFMLICMGSCLFSIVSRFAAYGVPNADPGRIGAQLVTGIGFIGAGTIFRSPKGVSGLTTAALMWLTAAVGMAVGYYRIALAVEATLLAVIFMAFLNFVHRVIRKIRPTFYRQNPKAQDIE